MSSSRAIRLVASIATVSLNRFPIVRISSWVGTCAMSSPGSRRELLSIGINFFWWRASLWPQPLVSELGRLCFLTHGADILTHMLLIRLLMSSFAGRLPFDMALYPLRPLWLVAKTPVRLTNCTIAPIKPTIWPATPVQHKCGNPMASASLTTAFHCDPSAPSGLADSSLPPVFGDIPLRTTVLIFPAAYHGIILVFWVHWPQQN